jgi:hypothetical protein
MKIRMIVIAMVAFGSLSTGALAQSDPATCAVKCHAANPNGCDGNSRATQICYNKCVGYVQCPQPDKGKK